ncbi:MAG: DUF1893 domain-containing protein [Kiritimatiellae bacterium]|nr:DUF1893 domain-containing protein [Kiritimatiellia bacterium]
MNAISRGQFIASALAVSASAVCRETFAADDALAEAWRLIEEEGACRVVVKDGRIVAVARGRGAGPVLRLLESDFESLANATVVDSVVGLAAAAAAVKGGVARVCARTASETARNFLASNGIPLEAKVVVPTIMNRDLTGPCPLESGLASLTSADAMLAKAESILAGLRSIA